jgi:predicted nucleotidyltransferase
LEDYLSVDPRREVIESMGPDDLDLVGWDLRKALVLLRKSNPSLFEWLRSPIVYRDEFGFLARFEAVGRSVYAPQRLRQHYRSMALHHWNSYLAGRATVAAKRYLYTLRPLLAVHWLDQQPEQVVPIQFSELLQGVPLDDAVRKAVVRLVNRKAAGEEMAHEPADPLLHGFLENEIALVAAAPCSAAERSVNQPNFDTFFRNEVMSLNQLNENQNQPNF